MVAFFFLRRHYGLIRWLYSALQGSMNWKCLLFVKFGLFICLCFSCNVFSSYNPMLITYTEDRRYIRITSNELYWVLYYPLPWDIRCRLLSPGSVMFYMSRYRYFLHCGMQGWVLHRAFLTDAAPSTAPAFAEQMREMLRTYNFALRHLPASNSSMHTSELKKIHPSHLLPGQPEHCV